MPGDAEVSDAGPVFDAALASDAAAAVRVTNLRADWATPNTIRWRWDRQGDLSQLASVEVVVGESPADVAGRSGTAKVWTKAENAELGVTFLTDSGDNDPVLYTLVDGLTPSTRYWAQLEAVDLAGRRSTTDLASTTTAAAATHQLVIFSEATPAGYTIPNTFQPGTTDPYAGATDYEYRPVCPSATSCFEILRWQLLGLDTSVVPEDAYEDSAFVEFALENRGQPSLWSQVRLWYSGCTGHMGMYAPLTIAGGGRYRLYQIPLHAFDYDTGLLPYSTFATGLCEFGPGAEWTDQQLVLMDEVRLRW
jgi:hypothetical protein